MEPLLALANHFDTSITSTSFITRRSKWDRAHGLMNCKGRWRPGLVLSRFTKFADNGVEQFLVCYIANHGTAMGRRLLASFPFATTVAAKSRLNNNPVPLGSPALSGSTMLPA